MFKVSLFFGVGLLVVIVVAVAALYSLLDGLGVFDSVVETVRTATETPDGTDAAGGLERAFTPERIIGGAAVLGAINVLIVTALATLAALLYNLCAAVFGGIEVTLAERD